MTHFKLNYNIFNGLSEVILVKVNSKLFCTRQLHLQTAIAPKIKNKVRNHFPDVDVKGEEIDIKIYRLALNPYTGCPEMFQLLTLNISIMDNIRFLISPTMYPLLSKNVAF